MRPLRRLLVLACVLGLLSASATALAAEAAPSGDARTTLSKKKSKRCKKGYKPRTVIKKGKKVRVCRKVRKAAPGPTPAPAPTPAGLFEAPGQKLEGDAAKPFLQKYLLDSTFTDCPAGWPACSVEQRYSHAADSSFFYCRLTSSSGSDIRSVGEYGVDNARVEPDGSWIFHEVVLAYGNHSEYEWQVSADGVVTGAYRFQPDSALEQLGPLQYVGGARDCSY